MKKEKKDMNGKQINKTHKFYTTLHPQNPLNNSSLASTYLTNPSLLIFTPSLTKGREKKKKEKTAQRNANTNDEKDSEGMK